MYHDFVLVQIEVNPMKKRDLDAAIVVLSELCLPLDRIPYTPHFDQAARRFSEIVGNEQPFHEIWHALTSARKRGLGTRRFR